MLFSIIMPIYNMEKYLSKTIESVLNQTFKEFELILINDGSTDKSLEIANFYKEKDNRIQIVSQENKGVSVARNAGLNLAKGQYIFFIDSDDWILNNTLQEISEKLKIKNYDYVSFAANTFVSQYNDKNNLQRFTNYYERPYLKEKEYSADEYQEKMFKHGNYVGSGCLYVFKNGLAKKNNLQFVDGIYHEDNLFTRELLSYAENVYFIPKKFYQRRVRQESRSFKKTYFTSPHSYLIIAERLFELSVKKEKDKNLRKGAKYYFDKALNLIQEEFRNSKEFKSRLFKIHKKLQLKEYNYAIFELKYPFFAPLLLIVLKAKNKLFELFKI